MSSSEHVQTVRNAWINRVRDEALRMRRPEVSKCAQIGMLIATYADADGSNAFPSGATLGAIAGCTEETVTRCVKVLVAVGLLERKRRPNKSAMYRLIVPMKRPLWAPHLHLYTDTRQAKRKRELKEKEVAEALAAREAEAARNPLQNGIRDPFQNGVAEPVPAGGSEESGTRSGTPSVPVAERVPEPVPAGGDQYIPTFGRDPDSDHNMADHLAQPPKPAGAREAPDAAPGLRSVPGPPGGRATSKAEAPDGSSQRPLLLAVRSRAELSRDELAALRAAATPEEVRQAIAELGAGQASRLYGTRLVAQHLPDTDTDT
ncbi:hypothetical protein ACRJ4B_49915 [Streptomyces sp. GTA36]